MTEKQIYLFEEGSAKMKSILGGKGANLAEMTTIGLPIPPGFTITTTMCKEYNKIGHKFPAGVLEGAREAMKSVETKTGKKFGDASNPLLVSVRSGAPVSMPGMMDTVLNLGLNDSTVKGLIALTNNERFGYDAYRRFMQMFGNVVLGVKHEQFEHALEEAKTKKGVKLDTDLDANDLQTVIASYKAIVKKELGKEFPSDVYEQLELAIRAVFDSWDTPRAVTYRKLHKISDDLGTAVNVQSMAFGNMGNDSGTGVAFTRNPSTGEKKLYGEYLMNAQGEDVVAGIRTPKPLAELEKESPEMYRQFAEIAKTLEKHYRDMQDMEFTIEKGKLYMLQTRSGKRTAAAAVKVAVDMVKEGVISKEEAIMRVEPEHIDKLLHRQFDPKAKVSVIAKGLPASPGAACGKAAFTADEAAARGKNGEKVLLVSVETTPEDIHGMAASQGILTSRGGMTSHAAVVARGMGIPCVAGCETMKVDIIAKKATIGDIVIKEGDVVTIEGSSGSVILGEVPMVDPTLTGDFEELLNWADSISRMSVRANADTPQNALSSREFGAKGIGLCRTERMFNAQDRLPIVQEMILAETKDERLVALGKLKVMQKSDFKAIFAAMDGLPVTIRFLDPPLHEFLPRLDELLVDVTKMSYEKSDDRVLADKQRILKKVRELSEFNPMLGHRGCRLGIAYPEIYEMQASAIFEAATELKKEGKDVQVEAMIPLVGNVRELKLLRTVVENVANRIIKEAGVTLPYTIGTMIEIPRAALTADQIAEVAEFFSFGTNDLTQTALGFSRDDAESKFLRLYLEKGILDSNPFEVLDREGVGKLVKMAVDLGRKTRPNMKIGVCGETGGEPSSIEFYHNAGLSYVSCSRFRVPIARLSAAQATLKEQAVAKFAPKGE
ncbi:MAG: pyruvate, phosphate dikinase [Candidatus Micrarchaeota archaeon]